MYSQEYNKVNGVWNAAFLDFPLSNKMSLRTELHLRTISYFKVWNQQIFRPQLSYTPSKNVSWRAGYSYLKNYDQDTTADPRIRNEHNIWEQVQFTLPPKESLFQYLDSIGTPFSGSFTFTTEQKTSRVRFF
jgi:hypothetical protein